MQSTLCIVMSEVPLALRQGPAPEVVSAKLIVLNDVGGATDEVWAKVGARGGARGLRCRASGLHPQQWIMNLRK
jgi:hypothetical protein